MTDNLALWNKLGKTDPKHTKAFKRAGGFSGTAMKPMWAYQRMTEEFGPCGTGWGIYEPTFQVVPGPEGEVLVYCTASIWYEKPDQRSWGVGGDKAVGKNKYGLVSDDEAFKKAFTDAITNALKMIGVGADIHMGLFDDNKYVNSMREEYDEEGTTDPRQAQAQDAAPGKPVQQGSLADKASVRSVTCVDQKQTPIEAALLMSIDVAETVTDLSDWAEQPENVDALAKLPDEAKARIRERWASVRKRLLNERAAA